MDGFIPTNTLAGVNFDVLKLDAVEDPLININKLATIDFDECYFTSAVDFINECNTEMTDKKIKFYNALSEATNEVAVLESFSDYFVGVKDIIAKFFKFLRNLVARFVAAINKFINSDKYITSHLKDLDGFKTDDDQFSFYGYNFTFSPSIPMASAALSFDASLFDDLATGIRDNNKGVLSSIGVKNVISNMTTEDKIDVFRAKVICKEGRIYSTDFQEELFAVYRDGNMDTTNIDVDESYVRNTIRQYKDHDKMKKEVEKQRKEIEKVYNQIEKSVADTVKANGGMNVSAFLGNLPDGVGITNVDSANDASISTTGANLNGDLMAQIDIYIKRKVDEVQEYSNNHLLAFTAKLDAIKDCYVQDRNVLYTALQRVNKSGNVTRKGKK